MKRRIFLKGAAGVTLGCTSAGKRRLNVYNWENYVARSTIPNFEKEFGCRVRYATYGSAEEMLAKVMSGNSGWDVVFPSNSFVQPMQELGLLARLDHARLPLLKNLDVPFRSPEWDRELAWCVPYMHSATGIVYSKKLTAAPTRWADLWSDRYERRLTMLDDPAENFAVCLKRLGCSINSGNPKELQLARDLATQQKPLVRAYLNEEARDQVVAGDILVAQMWAQVAQMAIDSAPDLAFSFPAEGFARYADNAVILRESKRQDLAHDFLNYLLRPDVAATIAIEMQTATVNKAARERLPATRRDNPVLYPPPDVLARGEWFRALTPESQRIRDRYWTEIKSA